MRMHGRLITGRKMALLTVAAGLATGTALPAFARPAFKVETTSPKRFEQVETELQRIQGYLDVMQCGGQLLDATVGEELGDPGAVSDVTGVPGRTGRPLDNIPSGLGKREEEGGQLNDGFQFPPTAEGLSTRCPLRTSETIKQRMHPRLLSMSEFPYVPMPYFEDPPCEQGADGRPDLTKESCIRFHEWLNGFKYADCYHVAGNRDIGFYCKLWCWKFSCTDGWTDSCDESLSALTDGALEDSPVPDIIRELRERGELPPEDPPQRPITILPNSVPCIGEQCRCEMPPSQGGVNTDDGDKSKDPVCRPPMLVPGSDIGSPDMSELAVEDEEILQGCRNYFNEVIRNGGDPSGSTRVECEIGLGLPEEGITGGVYSSYFRRYSAEYQRRKYEGVPGNDHNQNSGPVMCFGFYDEFDPRWHKTRTKDKRCFIGFDVSDYPQDQAGVSAEQPAPVSHDPNDRRELDFRINRDLWFQRLGGVLSFLNERRLGAALGARVAPTLTEGASVRGQLTAAPNLANRTLSFDDSADARTIVQWWEELELQMGRLLSPPTVRILLPPRAGYGIDPLDPLFVGGVVVATDPRRDPRSLPVEVQIRAKEDIVGEVAAYIERSPLLRIEQKDVPVVIPQISPVALRSIAQAWCKDVMDRTNAKNCDGAPADVKAYMDRLLQWSDDIESVRTLRIEQTKMMAAMIDFQSELSEELTSWVRDNEEELRAYLQRRRELLQLEEDWRETQDAYAAAAAADLPWCMNARFTLPIFSLLDDGLPGREEQGSLLGAGLPRLDDIAPPRDKVFDLSRFILQNDDPIAVPVLQPIQVTLDIDKLAPPRLGQPLVAPALPPMLSMTTLRERFEQAVRLPSAEEKSFIIREIPEIITTPDLLTEDQIAEVRTRLEETRAILAKMEETKREFWGSVLFNKADEVDPETLRCRGWDTSICKHVEMDLLERVMRIGSRPMISLKDDLRSVAQSRNAPDTCLPGNETCIPLNGEDRPVQRGWAVLPPTSRTDDGIDDVRRAMIDATVPEPLGGLDREQEPPYDARPNDLLPAYGVPPDTVITPAAPASTTSDE